MPKMKSHSGAKKRFKLTGSGKVKGRHAYSSHILEKKSPKRKRHLGQPTFLSDHDAPRVKKLLGAKSGGRRPNVRVAAADRTSAGGDPK